MRMISVVVCDDDIESGQKLIDLYYKIQKK